MESKFDNDLLFQYSDSELAHHIRVSPSPDSRSGVHYLSDNLVAKCCRPHIFEDMEKTIDVVQRLGICTPSPKRVVSFEDNRWFILDRIHGPTLHDAWHQLGLFRTINLAVQLRVAVKRLRGMKSPFIGSLKTGECRSFYLEDAFGLPPRCNKEDLLSFLRFWIGFTNSRKEMEVCQYGVYSKGMKSETNKKGRKARKRQILEEQIEKEHSIKSCRKRTPIKVEKASMANTREYPIDVIRMIPPTDQDFVLTHHDLAPRNLMVDLNGKLWLLDWEYSGFYPIYFEYAAMQNFEIPRTWNWFDRLRWTLFCWIAVGYYPRYANALGLIRSRFTRFLAGRRYHLLKYGGPHKNKVS
jgi:hypothetical protein